MGLKLGATPDRLGLILLWERYKTGGIGVDPPVSP